MKSDNLQVFGIDVGFSESRKTCCSCVLKLDGKTIVLKEKPNRFSFPDRVNELNRLHDECTPAVVAIDAPLTPKLIAERPSRGRAVDKLFSRGEFSNGRRGPQPGSIATPRQGWPLYKAGMEFLVSLQEVFSGSPYIRLNEIAAKQRLGAIEVIPKLTQTVLLPPSAITQRPNGSNIDEHLFPQLFVRHKRVVGKILRGFSLSPCVTRFIKEVSDAPTSHHEELAAFVAALQGVLCVLGSAEAIGHVGDFEGYFALPRRQFWHDEWRRVYDTVDRDECVAVTIEGNFT